MNIFIYRNNVQEGPYDKADLMKMNLDPSTPVWYRGLTEWIPASQAPELASLFAHASEKTAPTAPYPQAAQPSAQAAYAPEVKEVAHEATESAYQSMEKPQKYLIPIIITMFCCCMPAGVVALIYSCQIDSKYNMGDYDGAMKASKTAKTWMFVALGGGLLVWLLYIAYIVFLVMAGSTGRYY